MLLILWDIDNTLIDNGGISKQTYATAYTMLTGSPAAHVARTDGRTDPQIMLDLLQQHGIEPGPALLERVPAVLAEALERHAGDLQRRGRAMPGALEALTAVAAVPGVVQSVLTGNIRDNAHLKLSVFGLAGHIDWQAGAFGGDAHHRPALVGIAQQRATATFGHPFSAGNTVLIGDTLRDVQAGVEGGAKVIAVATGTTPASALRAAGAATVLADLTATAPLVAAITGTPGQAPAAN